MATSNPSLVRDNSTLANFKSWGSAISAFMATAGWLQSGDTGQVDWSTIASVPGANAFLYEIWEPNDSLTNFFLKIEYGNGSASGNTNPIMRLSIGTGTNGAGTLSGFVTSAISIPQNQVNVTSTSTTFSCFMSGEPGRIGILMWTTDTTNAGPLMFAVQRSLNNSGAPTSTFVTLFSAANGSNSAPCFQQSLVFGSGAGTLVTPGGLGDQQNTASFICLKNGTIISDVAFGSIAFSPVFPDVGFFGNPHDQVCVGSISDWVDSTTTVIAAANMPYGTSHTYVASKNNPMGWVAVASNKIAALLMRYD